MLIFPNKEAEFGARAPSQVLSRIHPALAHVPRISGVADYIDGLERDKQVR